jgi:hypothetical protein
MSFMFELIKYNKYRNVRHVVRRNIRCPRKRLIFESQNNYSCVLFDCEFPQGQAEKGQIEKFLF